MSAPTPASAIAGAALVGRARACAAIDDAVSDATGGFASVVVLEGGWGSGKTALIEYARSRAAAHDFALLRATANAFDRDLDHGVLRQLTDVVSQRSELTSPEALQRVVRDLCIDRPVAVLVDDAHHADRASSLALARLLAHLDGHDALVVVAGAPRAVDGWDVVRAAAARRAGTRFVRLTPLDHDAISAIARGAGASLDDVDVFALRLLTGGNPSLVCAAADALAAGATLDALTGDWLPDVVRHRAAALVAGISADARRIVEVVAAATVVRVAIGDTESNATVRMVAELLELDPAAVSRALDELVDAGVLATRDVHSMPPLLAAAIVARMSGSRREATHGALANALWSAGAPSSIVVEHLQRTIPGHSTWAVGMLRAAAGEATARGDHRRALALLRRALDEQPVGPVRASLLADLAAIEAMIGSPSVWRQVDTALAALANDEQRVELLYRVGRALAARGDRADAARAFERGMALHVSDEWDLLLSAALVNASRLDAAVRHRYGRRIGELLEPAPSRPSTGARAAWAELAYELMLRNEPAADVVAVARRALVDDGGVLVDDPALLTATGVLAYAGDPEHARRALDAALARVDLDGTTLPAVASLHFRRGQCLLFLGELQAAHDALQHVIAMGALGWGEYLSAAYARLAMVLLETNETVDPAAALLDGVPQLTEPAQHPADAVVVMARGRIRLEQRRWHDALEDFTLAGRLTAPLGHRNPSVLPWRSAAALAAHRIGALAAARKLADDELSDARRFGEPRSLARSLRVAGLVHERDVALRYLHEAHEVVAGSAARLEHAYVLAGLGYAYRRAGNISRAKQYLRDAGDLAERLGAVALAARVHSALRRTGARPRRLQVKGPGSLTPAER
ncbi:MAG TPA: BREX system ATP-binding domain-containing protein, partial [Acidimicrobiales bacterium]